MEKGVLLYRISIFGRFSYIYANINIFAKQFNDYKKQVSTDTIFNGALVNCYHLISNNLSIIIRNDRIDFEIKEIKSRFDLVIDAFEKVKPFLDSGINRIAINYNIYYEDITGGFLDKLSKETSFIPVNGELSEVNFGKNYITTYNEDKFNNIVTIQNVLLQKAESFDSFNAIVLLIDVNSVVDPNGVSNEKFMKDFKTYCNYLFDTSDKIYVDFDSKFGGE